jgi:predicted glycoside hydrolase/deacetylase ChbG (UPF0249 family)
MVRSSAAVDAVRSARDRPDLSIGLHVDLCEWEYRNGAWVPIYEVVDLNESEALAEEVARQLHAFRDLVGRDPTHLDSHQHVHRKEPVKSVMVALARDLALPLRHFCPSITYRNDFYGQTRTGVSLPGALDVDRLIEVLKSLTAGISELSCHPGLRSDLASSYRAERAREIETLCDPRVRETILAEGIELRNFSGPAGRPV